MMKKANLIMMLGMFVWMIQDTAAQSTQPGIGTASKPGSTQGGSPSTYGGHQKSSTKSSVSKSAKSGTTKTGSGSTSGGTGTMMGASRTGTAGGNGKTGTTRPNSQQ